MLLLFLCFSLAKNTGNDKTEVSWFLFFVYCFSLRKKKKPENDKTEVVDFLFFVYLF